MKTFIEYITETKEHYGTCVDSFCTRTGNRKRTKGRVPYRDASDFANEVQDFASGENKKEHEISREEFSKKCHIAPEHKKLFDDPTTKFYHHKERDSHMMYDTKKDVHHFYEDT